MRFTFVVHPLDNTMLRLYGVRAVQPALVFSSEERLARLAVEPGRTAPLNNLPFIRSDLGEWCEGRIVGIPSRAEDMLVDQEHAVTLMLEAIERHGSDADLIGLGAVCAIVGLRGEALAERVSQPVTTGNSLTVWAATETVCRLWTALEGERRFRPRVLVVGVPGTVPDAVLAMLLRRGLPVEVYHPRFPRRVERQLALLEAAHGPIRRVTDLDAALRDKGIVVAASSVGSALVGHDLRPGTVVVDVARPLDTSPGQRSRGDLVVVEGEMVAMPKASGLLWQGFWTWPYNLIVGQGTRRVFACLAEPMVLCLEGRAESFSLGRSLDVDRIEGLGEAARRHGFAIASLFRGREEISERWLAEFMSVPWLP